MKMNDISFIGWIHTLAYVVAMVLANVSAMVIFHGQEIFVRIGQPPVFHQGFGLFHWFAAITLLFVLLGRLSASLQSHAFFACSHSTRPLPGGPQSRWLQTRLYHSVLPGCALARNDSHRRSPNEAIPSSIGVSPPE
jgi:hypothetical protein